MLFFAYLYRVFHIFFMMNGSTVYSKHFYIFLENPICLSKRHCGVLGGCLVKNAHPLLHSGHQIRVCKIVFSSSPGEKSDHLKKCITYNLRCGMTYVLTFTIQSYMFLKTFQYIQLVVDKYIAMAHRQIHLSVWLISVLKNFIV